MSDQEKSPDWKGYGVDQAVVETWVRSRLGDKVFESKEERGARVMEEAIELYQVEATDQKAARIKAHKMVDRVFDGKPGELKQEIGGVIVCLLAACASHELRLDEIAWEEIKRIMAMQAEHFRKKQGLKADAGLAIRPE